MTPQFQSSWNCQNTTKRNFVNLHSWTSQIQGTDAYWGDVRRHCEACIRHNIIRGRGLPSFSITSSCAEFHHPALSRLVAEAVAYEKLHVPSQQDSQDQNFLRVEPGKMWVLTSIQEWIWIISTDIEWFSIIRKSRFSFLNFGHDST